MYRDTRELESPFELKVKGDFGRALTVYARRYAESLQSENAPIADICFEQMFDLCLLEYLKEGVCFETKSKLLGTIEKRLADVLDLEASGGVKEFKQSLDSCKRRLFPRGRSTSGFSVDPQWLLKNNY